MMRRWPVLICLLLGACQPKTSDVNVTISGVTIQDIEGIKKELAAIAGVSDIRMGALKEGCVTLVVASTKKGGDLASTLAASASGLKNVKSFDDGAITIAYSAAAVPVAVVTPLAQPTQPSQPIQPIQPFQPQPQVQPQPQPTQPMRMPAGNTKTFQEVSFDLPQGWQGQPSADGGGIDITPGDRQQGEVYSIRCDPALKTLEGPDFDRSVQGSLEQFGLENLRSQPSMKARFGNLEGVFCRAVGTHPQGFELEVRFFWFMGSQSACAFIVLGLPQVLDQRVSQINSITGSLRRSGAVPLTPGRPGN